MPQATSTRWCPTPEQLMILEEMYRSGVRTPNAPQIQQITAHLSYYGKIEGKNVFYWFQNHKARDRQKLRRRLGRHLHQHQMSHHAPPFHQTSEAPYSSSSSWNQQRQILHQISPPFVHQRFSQEGTAAMNLISKLEASEGGEKLEKAMAAFPVSFASETTAVAATDAYATLPAGCRLPRTLELFPTRSTAGFREEGGTSKPADSRFTSP